MLMPIFGVGTGTVSDMQIDFGVDVSVEYGYRFLRFVLVSC